MNSTEITDSSTKTVSSILRDPVKLTCRFLQFVKLVKYAQQLDTFFKQHPKHPYIPFIVLLPILTISSILLIATQPIPTILRILYLFLGILSFRYYSILLNKWSIILFPFLSSSILLSIALLGRIYPNYNNQYLLMSAIVPPCFAVDEKYAWTRVIIFFTGVLCLSGADSSPIEPTFSILFSNLVLAMEAILIILFSNLSRFHGLSTSISVVRKIETKIAVILSNYFPSHVTQRILKSNRQILYKTSFLFKYIERFRSLFSSHHDSLDVVTKNASILFFQIVPKYTFNKQHLQEPQILNALSIAVDTLCERIGVIRIKVIGSNTWLIGAGFGDESDEIQDGSSVDTNSLEMKRKNAELLLQFISQLHMIFSERLNSESFKVVYAVHFGDILSGVLNRYRINFDIFGDPVNVCHRIMSFGKSLCEIEDESIRSRFYRGMSSQSSSSSSSLLSFQKNHHRRSSSVKIRISPQHRRGSSSSFSDTFESLNVLSHPIQVFGTIVSNAESGSDTDNLMDPGSDIEESEINQTNSPFSSNLKISGAKSPASSSSQESPANQSPPMNIPHTRLNLELLQNPPLLFVPSSHGKNHHSPRFNSQLDSDESVTPKGENHPIAGKTVPYYFLVHKDYVSLFQGNSGVEAITSQLVDLKGIGQQEIFQLSLIKDPKKFSKTNLILKRPFVVPPINFAYSLTQSVAIFTMIGVFITLLSRILVFPLEDIPLITWILRPISVIMGIFAIFILHINKNSDLMISISLCVISLIMPVASLIRFLPGGRATSYYLVLFSASIFTICGQITVHEWCFYTIYFTPIVFLFFFEFQMAYSFINVGVSHEPSIIGGNQLLSSIIYAAFFFWIFHYVDFTIRSITQIHIQGHRILRSIVPNTLYKHYFDINFDSNESYVSSIQQLAEPSKTKGALLYLDIANFTPLCVQQKIGAVKLLNQLFGIFDKLTLYYSGVKFLTIGDAYIVFSRNVFHPQDIYHEKSPELVGADSIESNSIEMETFDQIGRNNTRSLEQFDRSLQIESIKENVVRKSSSTNSLTVSAEEVQAEEFSDKQYSSNMTLQRCIAKNPKQISKEEVENLILLGLEMIYVCIKFSKKYNINLPLRILISKASISAGIIGSKPVTFHYWGKELTIADSLNNLCEHNTLFVEQLLLDQYMISSNLTVVGTKRPLYMPGTNKRQLLATPAGPNLIKGPKGFSAISQAESL